MAHEMKPLKTFTRFLFVFFFVLFFLFQWVLLLLWPIFCFWVSFNAMAVRRGYFGLKKQTSCMRLLLAVRGEYF